MLQRMKCGDPASMPLRRLMEGADARLLASRCS